MCQVHHHATWMGESRITVVFVASHEVPNQPSDLVDVVMARHPLTTCVQHEG